MSEADRQQTHTVEPAANVSDMEANSDTYIQHSDTDQTDVGPATNALPFILPKKVKQRGRPTAVR